MRFNKLFCCVLVLLFLTLATSCIQTSSEPDIVSYEVIDQPPFTDTPIPSTEEASILELTPPSFEAEFPSNLVTVSGQVINGTEGHQVPDNLEVTLRIAGLSETNDVIDLFRMKGALDEEKRFVFTEVPREEATVLILETVYAAISQQHVRMFSTTTQSELNVDFVIYETTHEPVDIQLFYVESLVAGIGQDFSLVYQNFEFINNSDRVYLGDNNGHTLLITFPEFATNIEIRGEMGRFEFARESENILYYDTEPIFPESIKSITTRYALPYMDSMSVRQTFPYDAQEVGVFIPARRNLKLESEQLVSTGSEQVEGVVYYGFGLKNSQGLSADTLLTYRVYDDSSDVVTSDESFLERNTSLILGLGIFLLVVGGVFLTYDLRKQQSSVPMTKQELLEAIATLDKEYEAGKIEEEAYLMQREDLKAKLREVMYSA